MNKPDLDTQNSPFGSLLPSARLTSLPSERLVVLIPDEESVDNELAHRIWVLASPSGLQVLFLALCSDAGEEVNLRRQLVTQAAAIQDNRVSVGIQIEYGNDWIEKLKPVLRPGDTIVCFAGQQTGWQHRPLSQVLSSNFKAPVHILSSPHPPPGDTKSGLLSQVVSWTGSIGIILGFFWIQVRIDQLPKDWAHTTLLCLSVAIEISLIWLWNSLTA